MNNITKILKSELVNLLIRQGQKLEKHHTKTEGHNILKWKLTLSYQFSLSFLAAKAKKKKRKIIYETYAIWKAQQNSKNSIQSFAEPHTNSRELNPGFWKVKRKWEQEGGPWILNWGITELNKVRQISLWQDFGRNFNVLITNLQRAAQCALLI